MNNDEVMQLKSGDVVALDFGLPEGSEAGFKRFGVVITADTILKGSPTVVHVVPLTTTVRNSGAEVILEPDKQNGLANESAAQCQHLRAVVTTRLGETIGNVGVVSARQIRATVALIIDAC